MMKGIAERNVGIGSYRNSKYEAECRPTKTGRGYDRVRKATEPVSHD